MSDATSFHAKVEATEIVNEDGSCREELIKPLRPAQPVEFVVRSPRKYADRVVMVCSKGGSYQPSQTLGHLSDVDSRRVMDLLDKGVAVEGEVAAVECGSGILWWKKPAALTIRISHPEREAIGEAVADETG